MRKSKRNKIIKIESTTDLPESLAGYKEHTNILEEYLFDYQATIA